MAQQRISEFKELNDPQSDDYGILVDVSDTSASPDGTTKRIPYTLLKGDPGINWRGDYDDATFYQVNDAVYYGGSSYIAIADTAGNIPENTQFWDTLVVKGSSGAFTKTVSPGGDIQAAINDVQNAGGGNVLLETGVYEISDDIVMSSNVYLKAASQRGAVIDFQNTQSAIVVKGSNVYNTGTVSVESGSAEVVGINTEWLGDVQPGQSILLNGTWYPIVTVSSNTLMTIAAPLAGQPISSQSYTVATTIKDVQVIGVVVQNSASYGIDVQYADDFGTEKISIRTCANALRLQDTSQVTAQEINTVGNQNGIIFSNTHLLQLLGVGVNNTANGNALTIDKGSSNISVLNSFFLSQGGVGIRLDNAQRVTIQASTVTVSGSDGISIENSENIIILSVNSAGNAGSGVNIVAETLNTTVNSSAMQGNQNNGVNIAAASVEKTIVIANHLDGNGNLGISDNGTGTVNTGNVT